MAWIESHQSLGQHPKTIRLAGLLKVRVPEAVGLLQFLWWWALDYAADGQVAVADQQVVARACQWHGPPAKFWEALSQVGFIDPGAQPDTWQIHKWMDYAGRLIAARAAHAERTRTKRAQQRAGLPNRTQPYPTGPDSTSPPPVPPRNDPAQNGAVRGTFTCCVLADVSQGKEHMLSCPTLAQV